MASLEHLPKEITEIIVTSLPLADISNLRLSSRTLRASATQDHYKSHLRSKTVDLTCPRLHGLVQAMSLPLLATCLRYLTLVGVVCEAGEKAKHQQPQQDQENFQASEADERLVSASFRNLQERSKLDSLSLLVAVHRTQDMHGEAPAPHRHDWVKVWDAAANLFHATMRSIAESGARFNKFNVFYDDQGCSLACDELAKIDWSHSSLVSSMGSLRSLSLSFSDRRIEPRRDDALIEEASVQAASDENFSGLAELLYHCSSLEELRLHHSRLWGRGAGEVVASLRYKHFQNVAATAQLPNLRKLTIVGLVVHERDMISLVGNAALQEVRFDNVILEHGTFRNMFDKWSGKESSLQRLHLHALSERGSVKFEETSHRGSWKSTLERSGLEIANPIIYHVTHTRSKATTAGAARRRERRKKYGPY